MTEFKSCQLFLNSFFSLKYFLYNWTIGIDIKNKINYGYQNQIIDAFNGYQKNSLCMDLTLIRVHLNFILRPEYCC